MPTEPERSFGTFVLGTLLLGALSLAAAPPPAEAQTYTGPSKCVGCHDHERQAKKWQKEEPAALKGKAHYNTLKQLDAPKSAQWTKAIGQADPYDVKGSCVRCHGTVYRGDANAGVSCESCHGPSSNYNDIHQEKGAYAKAVAAGLRDLKEKPPNIVKACVECHVLTDRKLAAAGHPTGADFDAGASIQKLVHWDTAYNYAAITAAARTAMGGKAIPAGSAAPPATPAGAKTPPAPPGGGAPPPVTSPATAPPPTAAVKPPTAASAPRKATTPAAPAPPPAPWDWDQPVRPLPDDYVPETATAAEPEAAAVAEEPPPAAGAQARPPEAPRPPRTRRALVVPPSLAEETPLAVPLPGAPSPVVAPAVEAVETKAPGPPAARTPAAEAAALRGEAVRVLEKLLRAGARTKDAPEPARPSEYSGPDGELLRLQDEVIALCLEALRRPQ